MIKHLKEKLIIFHDSILPKYRGFSPLVSSLINGEQTIDVTAIFGDEKYDEGEVLAQSVSKITYPIKIQAAINLGNEDVYKCGEQILEKIINKIPITGIKQNNSPVSFSMWRNDKDYFIDWNKSSSEIIRFIDAVGFPYLGACSICNGSLIRIINAIEMHDVNIENRTPGKVIFVEDGLPVVVCGDGLLKITEAFYGDKEADFNFLPMSQFRLRFTGTSF